MFRRSQWPLRAIVILAAVLTLAARTSISKVDYDIWHEMALAREIIASGQAPKADIFAYTPTSTPFVHHEWGAGVVAYLLATQFGPTGILVLKYVLVAAMAALCVLCGRRRGGPFENWAILVIPASWIVGIGYMPVRAQAYSFAAAAALFWCLYRDDEGSRKWIVPWLLFFPIWANLHGGCSVAFTIIGAHWVERILVRKPHAHLLGVAGAMLALLLINPYGADYPVYLWRALGMARPNITEWRPIWLHDQALIYPYAICLAVTAYAFIDALRRRAGLPFGSAVVGLMAIAGTKHVKLAPFFAAAFIAFVPAWLAATPVGRWMASVNRNWRDVAAAPWMAWIVALAASGVLTGGDTFRIAVPGSSPDNSDTRLYPAGAVEYLRDRKFAGNLMTPFEMGAYCMWKLHPAVRVSLDSRYELVFSNELFDEHRAFYDAKPGWERTLNAYGTDAALIPVKAKVARAMPSSGWTRVYSDPAYEVYARPGLSLTPVKREGTPPDGAIP